jgi:hypothetical protein
MPMGFRKCEVGGLFSEWIAGDNYKKEGRVTSLFFIVSDALK